MTPYFKFALFCILSVVCFFALVLLTGCSDPVTDCVSAVMRANPEAPRDKARAFAYMVCLEQAKGTTS